MPRVLSAITDSARGLRPLRTAFAALVAVLLTAPAAFALDLGKLKGWAWGSKGANVVVVLHGDSGPEGSSATSGSHSNKAAAGAYAAFAQGIAQSFPGTTVVLLTRPGFTGSKGKSPGNNPTKDHYTAQNNKLLAQSLQTIKVSSGAQRLIVVGHSGGAAQLGTIVGSYPGTVDVAILAACPCDVPNWRIHRRGSNSWKSSQSPLDYAGKVPRNTKVIAITGSADNNTLPKYAADYVATAQSAGVDATMSKPAGADHNWATLQSTVTKQIRANLK